MAGRLAAAGAATLLAAGVLVPSATRAGTPPVGPLDQAAGAQAAAPSLVRAVAGVAATPASAAIAVHAVTLAGPAAPPGVSLGKALDHPGLNVLVTAPTGCTFLGPASERGTRWILLGSLSSEAAGVHKGLWILRPLLLPLSDAWLRVYCGSTAVASPSLSTLPDGSEVLSHAEVQKTPYQSGPGVAGVWAAKSELLASIPGAPAVAADTVTVGTATFAAGKAFTDAASLARAIDGAGAATGVAATASGNTVDLVALMPGSAGNAIALRASNPKDDAVTAFSGGSEAAVRQVVLTFAQPMDRATLGTSNLATALTLTGGGTFGSGATGTWSAQGTVFTIDVGTGASITSADSVGVASTVRDAAGASLSPGNVPVVYAAAPTVVDATYSTGLPSSQATAGIDLKAFNPGKPAVAATATITVTAFPAGLSAFADCTDGELGMAFVSSSSVQFPFTSVYDLAYALGTEGASCITARASGNQVTLTWNTPGKAGNGKLFVINIPQGIEYTQLTGGVDAVPADSVTVGGETFVASSLAQRGTSLGGTSVYAGPDAASLAQTISQFSDYIGATANATGEQITLTATEPGTAGNSISLAASKPADAVVTPFHGGTAGAPGTAALIFNEPMAPGASWATTPGLYALGFGRGAQGSWNAADTMLTVTPGAGATLREGATVVFGGNLPVAANGLSLAGASATLGAPRPDIDPLIQMAANLGFLADLSGLSPASPITLAQAVEGSTAVFGLTPLPGASQTWPDLAPGQFGYGRLEAAFKAGALRSAGPSTGAELAPDQPLSATESNALFGQQPAPAVDIAGLSEGLVEMWVLVDIPVSITPTATPASVAPGQPVTIASPPGTDLLGETVPNQAFETVSLALLPGEASTCTVDPGPQTVSCDAPGTYTVDVTATVSDTLGTATFADPYLSPAPAGPTFTATGKATFTVTPPPPPPPPVIQVTGVSETPGTPIPATAILDVSGVQAALPAQSATTATATITLTNAQAGDTVTWTDPMVNFGVPFLFTDGSGGGPLNFTDANSLATDIAAADPNIGSISVSGNQLTIPWGTPGSVGNTTVVIQTSNSADIAVSRFSGGADATSAVAADTVTVGTKTLTAGVDFSTPLGLATAITTDQAQTGATAAYDATTQQVTLTSTAPGSAGNGQTLSVSSQVGDIVLAQGFQGGEATPATVALTFGAPIDQTTLGPANFASVLTPSSGGGFGAGATGAWNGTGTVFTIQLGTGTILPSGTTIAIASSVKGTEGQSVASPTAGLIAPP